MSPTLLREEGFKFFFYANEHKPRHIHIMKGDDYAKVNLESLEVKKNFFKPNEFKKVLKIINQHKDDFIRRWDEYFKR
jgi:hypothetical protein